MPRRCNLQVWSHVCPIIAALDLRSSNRLTRSRVVFRSVGDKDATVAIRMAWMTMRTRRSAAFSAILGGCHGGHGIRADVVTSHLIFRLGSALLANALSVCHEPRQHRRD